MGGNLSAEHTPNIRLSLVQTQPKQEGRQMDKRKKGPTKDLRLMVVGSSGPSQFQLTNAILGREEFSKDVTSTSYSMKMVTELAGRRVIVVNSPNIYDKDISHAKRKMELRRSKCLCIPGPHAFLVAFDMEKISLNDIKTVTLLKRRFGKNCLKHCLVLLAFEGNLEGVAVENRVKTDWYLRELITDYGGRYYVFNKNWRDRSQERSLLQKIDLMVASLGGGYFCSRTFQKAEDSVKKEETKLTKKRAEVVGKTWPKKDKQHGSGSIGSKRSSYSDVGVEIRTKAEQDNSWLRTSLARGLGTGLVVGAAVGALFGSIEGPGGMVLYGIIGGAVGGSAGGTAQVAIKNLENRVAPPTRLNFNSIFINRFFTAHRS